MILYYPYNMKILGCLRKKAGLTLLETLVAMVILAISAAGVLGSFSYAFKFVDRGSRKIEALNLSRMAVERYRAIWLADPQDARLSPNDTSTPPYADIADIINSDIKISNPDYNLEGTVRVIIRDRSTDAVNPIDAKQIDVKVNWGQ